MTYQADEFVSKQLSEVSQQALDESSDQMDELRGKAGLPKALSIVLYVCSIVFAICLVATIRSLIDGFSLEQQHQNAPVISWIMGGTAVVSLGLFLYGRYLFKKVAKDDKTDYAVSKHNSVLENAISELGIPGDAQDVDFFIFRYTQKNNEIVIKKHDFYHFMIPVSLSVYRNGEKLCIADVTKVLEFPVAEFTKITTINKSAFITEWNKNESPKQGKYKQYKIKDVQGGLLVKPYHILHLVHNGEEICMYFPCYELPVIEKLTGLVAEQEEK